METTTLRFWNGNGLMVVKLSDLNKTALSDGSGCRIYAAAASLDDVAAMIAEYRVERASPELLHHLQKRWIRGGWPKFMEGKGRAPGLWLDHGPTFGIQATQIWPALPEW